MRKITYGIGSLALAALVLTGCAGGATTDTKTDSTGSDTTKTQAVEETTAAADETNANCPALKVGDTVQAATLTACGAEALGKVPGYAAKGTALGMETTMKANPSADEWETTVNGIGTAISIGGKTYVQPTGGAWAAGDAASADPMVAMLTTMGDALPKAISASAGAAVSGEYKVTGTDTKLGQEVFKLEGQTTVSGASATGTFFVTKDYATLESTTSAEANGQKVETTSVVTEWDKKQDIKAPM